jgi:type IV pilus assembly protein PilB
MAKLRLRGSGPEGAGRVGHSPGDDAPQGPSPADTKLGEYLVQHGQISPDQLAQALAARTNGNTAVPLGDLLVQKAFLSRTAVLEALSTVFGIPSVELRTRAPDPEVIAEVPEAEVRATLTLPLAIEDGKLVVATADPSDENLNRIRQSAGKPVTFLLATAEDIHRAIDRAYRADQDIDRFVKVFEQTEAQSSAVKVAEGVVDDDAPVVQVVNRVVAQALRDRASDVHLEPLEDSLQVRFRIDGTLVDAFSLPVAITPALVSRIKIMGGMNIVERRRPQDGQFSLTVDNKDVDVRVASVATVFGEKVVLRLLDKSRSMLHMSQLGMPPDTYEQYRQLVHSPFGMVICAGPTGAGKTTTLYATLGEVNSSGKNVMTIEDPVEYVFSGINQIQTNDQAGITFATGLKAILRQDPDVILVGEIRDADTARIAIQSALTGHFVLSSLHGTDSVAALHRFLDMGIESFLIASSVVAVVGQRLLRRICDSCKEAYEPEPEELAFFQQHGGGAKTQFWHGVGCNFCAGTGYRDRIGVYELLKITPEIRRLIVGWATQEELRRLATAQGMRTLAEEAILLVEQDITTVSEVIRTLYSA